MHINNYVMFRRLKDILVAFVALGLILSGLPVHAAQGGPAMTKAGSGSAQPVVTEIIVMLWPQGLMETAAPAPLAPEALDRLTNAARMTLTQVRVTPTNGQVLALPHPLSLEEARAVTAKIEMLPGVLWAEPVVAAAGAGVRAQGAPAGGAGSEALVGQIVVKLKDINIQQAAAHNKPLDLAVLAHLSQTAGVSLLMVRPMSGGAYVLGLPKEIPLSEAQAITQRLMGDPIVQYADPVTTLHPSMTPNDPDYQMQWNYFDPAGGIDLPAAWDITTGSPGVTVAVVDTGITSHPDLQAHVLPGYDMIYNERGPDPSDPGDWAYPGQCGPGDPEQFTPSSWHGTRVAGIIGAVTNNGIGVAGVDWDAQILPVRVLGRCGGSDPDIADSISWAAGLPVPGAPINPNPAKIINLSLGSTKPESCPWVMQQAIDNALAAGAVVVVAAGNESASASLYEPADCSGVISVAATTRADDLASYSNYGPNPTVTVAAPGGDGTSTFEHNILSTSNDGEYGPGNPFYGEDFGTSFSAPQVSGVAALMLSANPTLTPSQVRILIQETARPFASSTLCASLGCGAGIIDAAAAVAAAKTTGNVQPANPSPVYRFYNSATGSHFYTISEDEKNYVLRHIPQFELEGVAFNAFNYQVPGTLPVYRFYNVITGGYFYTISEDEKNYVLWHIPQFKLDENAAYFAYNTQVPGTLPVYRFYNVITGDHFYTISKDETNYVLKYSPAFFYEGIAYYALP
ncbi:MAG: S8 family peptidase [Desulfobacteraceae bacterium]|nr:S8 family peptidase [Desulfobacteraceae bacterium]